MIISRAHRTGTRSGAARWDGCDLHLYPLLHPEGDALYQGWPRGVGTFFTQCGGTRAGLPRPAAPPAPQEVSPCQRVPRAPPGPGPLAALLEQRLPKERRFLESKGLGAGAACELKSSAGKRSAFRRSLPFSRAQLSARFPRAQIVQWVRQSWQAPSKLARGSQAPAAAVRHPC